MKKYLTFRLEDKGQYGCARVGLFCYGRTQ